MPDTPNNNTNKILLDSFIDPQQMKADLEIQDFDLSTAMMRQAGLFAYYAGQAAKAEHQVGKIEQLVEINEAKLDREYRDRAINDAKKVTETQIKSSVTADPRMIRLQRTLNEARMIAGICKGAAEAFRHRKDMLIQVAYNQRAEMQGEVRVMNPAQEGESAVRHARARQFSQAS